jgi:hypothetical protein
LTTGLSCERVTAIGRPGVQLSGVEVLPTGPGVLVGQTMRAIAKQSTSSREIVPSDPRLALSPSGSSVSHLTRNWPHAFAVMRITAALAACCHDGSSAHLGS